MLLRAQSNVSTTAAKKATGKNWPQWFKILDKFPKEKTHTERAQWLYDHHLKKGWRRRASHGAWWRQMVTVTYEQARGLREKHQVVGGFQVSGSRTVPIPLSKLYTWWTTKRSTWLPTKEVKVFSATRNKYLHLDWPDGTKVDIGFYPKEKSKSSVQLQHSKLKTAAAGKKMKVWWADQLDRFAVMVSS